MGSLTNQSSSSKSMTGLSDVYSTDINCNNFTCDTSFTISPGCVISLPNNSIPDAALSTNVALLNRNPQTFTGVNNFTNTMNLTLGNTFNFNASSIANFATTSGGTSNTTIRQTTARLFLIRGEVASSRIEMQVRDASSVVDTCFYADSSTAYISSGTTEVLLSPTTINFTATTTPTMTTQPISSSNSNECASTAWAVSRLAFYALLAGGAGQTYTGIHNFPTPTAATNTTQVATTAYVKNQGYATTASLSAYVTLATTQTITAFKQFSTQPIFQQGLQSNQNIVCESIGGGGQQSIIVQDNAGLNILNVANGNSINLQTRTSGGVNVVNLTCENGNSTIIRGSLTMNDGAISFKDVGLGASFTQFYQTGVQLAIVPNHNSSIVSLYTKTSGGASVENIRCANGNSAILTGDVGNTLTVSASTTPTISIQPLSASNTNEIATTQWTKTQLTGYPTLNLNNTFNGTNNFTKTVGFKDVAPNFALVITNTVSANSGGILISAAGSYNGINNAGDMAMVATGTAIDTGILNLTTWATGTSGIKITNNAVKQYNPFECAYLQISPANTTKTNYNIGYQWTITAASFTSWATYTTANNIYTLAWDGSGDRQLGVWNVEISIGTWSSTNDMETLLVWNTISTTNKQANYTSSMCKGTADFFAVSLNIVKLNFVLNVTNLTTTYYLNYMRRLGTFVAIDTDSSFMRFTRIA